MASWQDLAGGEEVAVGGIKLPVTGIGIGGLKLLVQRFPQFVDVMMGQGAADVASLINDFPDAVMVAMAAGIGQPGNQECEEKLGALPLFDQVTLLEAIIRQTVGGDDPGPFLEKLKRIAGRLGISQEKLDDLTTSSPPPDSKLNGPTSETSPVNSQEPSSTSESAGTLT